MSQSEHIVSELDAISPLVAGIGTTNVYDLPEAYFINLSEEVLERIETASLKTRVHAGGNQFEIPEGYFTDLSATILARIHREEEANPKSELNRLSPLLAELPPALPYSAPDLYFNELAGDVVSGARAIDFVNQELELESSLLHQLERKNVYTVPPGYFFKLPFSVLQRVKGLPSSGGIVRTYRKMLGLMAAAILAGVIFIGTWSYLHRADLQGQGMDIANVDAGEISNYLDALPVLASDSLTAGATVNTLIEDESSKEIKQLLADVSDAELEKYIELHSVSKDLMAE